MNDKTTLGNLDADPDDPTEQQQPAAGAAAAGAAAADDDIEVVVDDGAEPDKPAAAATEGAEAEGAGISGEEDAELGQYSINVRKRIERERRLKEDERKKRIEVETRLKKSEDELSEFRSNERVSKIDKEISDTKTALAAAKDALEADKEVELLGKLSELNAQKIEAKRKPEARQEPARTEEGARDYKHRDTWFGRNAWFNDPKYKAQHDAALVINGEIHAEGKFDDQDPKYYEELDRRIAETVKVPKVERAADPVVPKPRANPAAGPSKHKVTLTKADLTNMQRFGLDTTNPAHLRQYAIEKRNSERKAAS